MRTVSWVSGLVVAGGLAGGIYYGVPAFYNQQIESYLASVQADLPEGHSLDYDRIHYNFWAGTLTLDNFKYAWPAQDTVKAERPFSAGGTFTLAQMTVNGPNSSLDLNSGNPSEPVADSLSWKGMALAGNSEKLALNIDEGTATGISLNSPELFKEGIFDVTGLRTALGLESLKTGPVSYQFEMMPKPGEHLAFEGRNESLSLQNLKDGIIGQAESRDSKITMLMALPDLPEEVQLAVDISVKSSAVNDMTVPVPAPAITQGDVPALEQWAGMEELLLLLVQVKNSYEHAEKYPAKLAHAQIEDMNIAFGPADSDERMPLHIKNIAVEDYTATSMGKMVVTDIQSGEGFPGKLSIGTLRYSDMDVTQLGGYLDNVIEMGPAKMLAALQGEDWRSVLPEFRLGELAYENVEISHEDLQDFKLGAFRIYDLGIDQDKAISLATEVKDIQLPLDQLKQLPPQQAVLLKAMGHDMLTLSANIDVDHSTSGQSLDINSLSVGAKELGDIALSGRLQNIDIAQLIKNAPLHGLASNLEQVKLTVKDRDFVRYGLKSFAEGRGISEQEALTQNRMMLGMMAGGTENADTIAFFTALSEFLDGSKALELTAAPASPIPVAQLFGAVQQAGPEALIQILQLKSQVSDQ
ncbi:hypothetical protein [Aestuariispira insulae]|uniref:DUF945 domain-containing protein n=1 Tax=Aestuariispira insulae TaxID=1461337 RepID=A0A3D9HWB2_9PROT|nr:hypothetical protein [Aestuariispira insulae]RED53705.1 hypothetical protein DFP90_101499 [Aestuariispira insulae]